MVLNKKLKKHRTTPPRGQMSLGRFIFKCAVKHMGHAILWARKTPGQILTKMSEYTLAMGVKALSRMMDIINLMFKRQKSITDYFVARQQPQQPQQ